MNNTEKLKQILIEKYYFEIEKALSEYIKDNKESFIYYGLFPEYYWVRTQVFLKSYDIVDLSYVLGEGTIIMEILIDAKIPFFVGRDLGYDRILNERFRIGANMDSNYNGIEIGYISLYLN